MADTGWTKGWPKNAVAYGNETRIGFVEYVADVSEEVVLLADAERLREERDEADAKLARHTRGRIDEVGDMYLAEKARAESLTHQLREAEQRLTRVREYCEERTQPQWDPSYRSMANVVLSLLDKEQDQTGGG